MPADPLATWALAIVVWVVVFKWVPVPSWRKRAPPPEPPPRRRRRTRRGTPVN